MHPFRELSGHPRRLGEALRAVRAHAGLSGEQLAKRLGISQSRVSRIELGQQVASADLVRRWAEVTGAPEKRCAELVGWAESAGSEAVAWRAAMGRGLARLQRDSCELEESAATIRSFQPVLVPDLLQVPEYARRIFAAGNPQHSTSEIAAAVAARMDRQLRLYEGTARFEFVITEAALRWRVGPPHVMLAQLDRITAVAGLDSVDVRVISLDTDLDTWHEHGFSLTDDRTGDDPAVAVEIQTSQVITTDPAEVAFYRDAFVRLREAAVYGAEVDALLHPIREGLLRAQSTR
ncbi:MAG TPA: helix-turn-helix transcriptional regulator [Pseudonocardiaceae bacterium]|nr:helix-turn-helix transcriptional regulator [Pseudonocardiaceae bacterium]